MGRTGTLPVHTYCVELPVPSEDAAKRKPNNKDDPAFKPDSTISGLDHFE